MGRRWIVEEDDGSGTGEMIGIIIVVAIVAFLIFVVFSRKKEKEVHLPFVFRKCIPIFSEILFILVGETNSILFGVNHSPSLEKVQHNY